MQPTAGTAASRRTLRAVLVSGIYPPDVGGPATHVVDLADALTERGHAVSVLTLWDGRGTDRTQALVRFPRRWPWAGRAAAVVGWLVRHRARYDVVYATGMQAEAVLGARLARRPVIVKIVGDPAWERGRRRGVTAQEFDEFQQSPSDGLAGRAMRTVRDWSVRAATRVIAPSEYLARCVEAWRGRADVSVIPNGVRAWAGRQREAPDAAGLRQVVVVSRLTGHKRIDVVIEAVARTDDVRLEVLGDGPERQRLEDLRDRLGLASRVAFAGNVAHDEVMARLAEADALLSASSYEGLPHVAIEALTVGTPVITSAAGGIREVLEDGTGGIIVEPATAEAFALVLGQLRSDPERLRRLRDGARLLGSRWCFSSCADRVEDLLLDSASGAR
ncbi:MAG: glycosyltransferase family 4 protein [Acidimicrobiia bacterium]